MLLNNRVFRVTFRVVVALLGVKGSSIRKTLFRKNDFSTKKSRSETHENKHAIKRPHPTVGTTRR